MWYAGMVGQLVPLLREESDVYLSREPAGYTNIVRKTDAKAVWVDPEGREFCDGDAVRCACKATVMTLSRDVTHCYPTEPVPVGSKHSVSICTFAQAAKSTSVQKTYSSPAAWALACRDLPPPAPSVDLVSVGYRFEPAASAANFYFGRLFRLEQLGFLDKGTIAQMCKSEKDPLQK
ncbi:MAG: hypothetical protein WBX27_08605 [Specibacter sp.]